jgi:hypothetical protein
VGYSEKPKINFELGQNRGKPFGLIEAKIKNLSLGYYNNLTYRRVWIFWI